MEDGRVVSDEFTQDGSVNIKGKPILKSKTGCWKACSFFVGMSLPLALLYCQESHFRIFVTI
jgi:hypothetical protein